MVDKCSCRNELTMIFAKGLRITIFTYEFKFSSYMTSARFLKSLIEVIFDWLTSEMKCCMFSVEMVISCNHVVLADSLPISIT